MCGFVAVWVCGSVGLWLCPSTGWSLHVAGGLVTAHGGRAGHCTWRAGDKAERSEVWVKDNECREKRGVGYAMLVLIKAQVH